MARTCRHREETEGDEGDKERETRPRESARDFRDSSNYSRAIIRGRIVTLSSRYNSIAALAKLEDTQGYVSPGIINVANFAKLRRSYPTIRKSPAVSWKRALISSEFKGATPSQPFLIRASGPGIDEAISLKTSATKFANLEIDIVGYEVSVYGPQSFSARLEERVRKRGEKDRS